MATEPTEADKGRELSKQIIDKYFTTNPYPYTRHHIESYNHFMSQDLLNIIKSNNPILILKDPIPKTDAYSYRVQLYVGGESGTDIQIGTPTLALHASKEVRLLYPNEARLRGLTYESVVTATILVKITYTRLDGNRLVEMDISPSADTFVHIPFFRIPIMLHSNYCLLNNKPKEFIRLAGECIEDHGGYFIVDGAEKVLIAKQEAAFNTLYISKKDHDTRDPKAILFASITCLSEKTRRTKRITFRIWKDGQILVGLPMVQAPVPLFILFRALGFQSDEEIVRLMFPDFETDEAKLFLPKLQPSMVAAFPFFNTYTATQYIKFLMKGRTEAHVVDLIKNQLFTHMPNDSMRQGLFLAECVRKCLRVAEGYDAPTDRDDIQNQRCLVSGFLIQMLFNHAYDVWIKAAKLAIDREWEFHTEEYRGDKFTNIFQTNQAPILFSTSGVNDRLGMNDVIMKAFKGKWGTGMGEDNEGVVQALSRLSYCDFMSHCRRVILEFDTGSKLQGPRRLHGSQYGYFCTNETPSGASIGISKNMTILMGFSIGMVSEQIEKWLLERIRVFSPADVPETLRPKHVPIFINGGLFGYTLTPFKVTRLMRAMKRTGCIPYSSSVVFSVRDRCIKLYFDGGRPLRPLIALEKGSIPKATLTGKKTWRDLVLGTLKATEAVGLNTVQFIDPLADKADVTIEDYIEHLEGHMGPIEYIDPYEQNEAYIANFMNNIKPETTHMEIHPSTILSFMTTLIPFCNHNQSLRNQLGDSQSKQGLSIYATNWQNRFDNTANILCYGQRHLTGTVYSNYMGEGKMTYGQNIIVAIAPSGFNQDDGFVFNADSIDRGMFRSINYRSYSIREEEDPMTGARTYIGNPETVEDWLNLRPGIDYSKLDERGIIRPGTMCDENTVLVGAYTVNNVGVVTDASLTPQVWTRGRVEKVVVTVDNSNRRLVRVRLVQDRIPEVGDKFSNRHGQKGTIGVFVKAQDMPRTREGVTPDMIMNMHAIPSRMTIAQNIEQLFGKAAALTGALADGTPFMNDGSPEAAIGALLEQKGFEKYGNELMYDGTTGVQMEMSLFIGPVFEMRLKHMVEDKWQARTQGRKEQMTHQPTGGRGAQGGLKIGEMDRDAIVGHSLSAFQRESYMKRSDGTKMPICTSCGTIPIYNPKMNIQQCTLCDGPAKYTGSTMTNMEILPSMKKRKGKIVTVEMPYATKVLTHELAGIPNIGLRFITSGDTERFRPLETKDKLTQQQAEQEASATLEPIVVSEEPFEEERIEAKEEEQPDQGLLGLMGAAISGITGTIAKTIKPVDETVLEGEEELEKAGAQKGDATLLQEAQKAEAEGVVEPVNPQVLAPVQPAPLQQQAPIQQQAPVEIVTVTTNPTTGAVTTAATTEPTIGTNKVITVNKQDGGGMTLTIQQPQPLRRPNTPSQNTVIYPAPFAGAPPTIAVQGPLEQEGGAPPILTIDTGYDAMVDSGLMPLMSQAAPRLRRKGPLELPRQIQQQYQQGGSSSGPITVNKLG